MRDYLAIGFALCVLCIVAGCKGEKPAAEATASTEADEAKKAAAPDAPPVERPAAVPAIPDSLPYGLVLAFSQFGVVDGKPTSEPGPARFDILTREDGEWKTEVVEDTQSNIFHKAMPFTPRGQPPGILTAAGTDAYVKFWYREKGKLRPTTLWHAEFGGKFNRIRDMEVADLDGDGTLEIVVGTHDQGVVAILRQRPHNKWTVEQVYERKDTFVHEIEIGDMDGDGVLEAYASLTPPNRFLEAGQGADVVRFVPKTKQRPAIVAALGERDIKEIYVGDVDGDGVDALYVSVEALMAGFRTDAQMLEPMKILRYDADTPPDGGIVVAAIPDRNARFVTVGDVDGDGKKEMVVASFSKGLWLLRPGKDPKSEWGLENIDRDSGGYEHAARFADLDGDGIDELYVADDKQGELRRYVWVNDRPKRVVIQKRDVLRSRMTWNIVEFLRKP
ncbi:MAG: VCBS repeat-containing protein [Deltaproteobacteria bacterium]|nr:VCBS repeat-containing protein [Deltaproteobacteria bacterium]